MADELHEVGAALDRSAMVSWAARAQCLLSTRFGSDLFSMPALNMLFDLYVSEVRQPRSLTNLCAASKAPTRTALRMINRLVERDLLMRIPDPRDQRRVNVDLSPNGRAQLDTYFDALLELLPAAPRSVPP